MDKNTVFRIQQYLESQNFLHIDSSQTKQQQRPDGRVFPFTEHIQALIYALLSNQRKWMDIENHLADIDALFFNYDPVKLKETDYRYFEDGLRNLHCGNRAVHKQMLHLRNRQQTVQSCDCV